MNATRLWLNISLKKGNNINKRHRILLNSFLSICLCKIKPSGVKINQTKTKSLVTRKLRLFAIPPSRVLHLLVEAYLLISEVIEFKFGAVIKLNFYRFT